jgi:hypothetical protein
MTKRAVLFGAGLLALISIAGLCFALGKSSAQIETRRIVAGLAAQTLSNDLSTIWFIERGDLDQARKLLRGETSGQLSWMMQRYQLDSSTVVSEEDCRLFNTLKQYRAKQALDGSGKAAFLSEFPGMAEEEKRRQEFLDHLNCGTAVLFKVD